MFSAANGSSLSTEIWARSSQEVYLTFIEKKFFLILKEYFRRLRNVKSVKISVPHPVVVHFYVRSVIFFIRMLLNIFILVGVLIAIESNDWALRMQQV